MDALSAVSDHFAHARMTHPTKEDRMIRVDSQQAATATDILANTDLDRAPGVGAIGIWVISDQTDSRVTVRIGSNQVASDITVPTGTLIDVNQPPIAMQPVGGGEKVTVDVVEVTAMAMHTTVIWLDQNGQ